MPSGRGGGFIRGIGGSPAFGRFGSAVAFPVERAWWRLFGRPLHRLVPQLLLVTVGRRSGRERGVPVAYLRDGDRLVVVGSNWGRRKHPEWSENLLARPRARVVLDGRSFPVDARLAAEHERDELWPRLLEVWPGWTAYAARVRRELRVFILDPAGS